MFSVIEANLIIICGMLPTLRKFFQSVAPKIIGDSYGRSTNKSGYGRSPGLITFGSLPSKGGMGHRGPPNSHAAAYANFGGGDLDINGYSLDRVAFGSSGRRSSLEHKKIDAYDEVGCKGRVDTHVAADYPRTGEWDGGESGLRRSLSRSRSVNRSLGSAGSEESQLPMMALGGKGKGIKATTRIEVSYVKRDPDEMI